MTTSKKNKAKKEMKIHKKKDIKIYVYIKMFRLLFVYILI